MQPYLSCLGDNVFDPGNGEEQVDVQVKPVLNGNQRDIGPIDEAVQRLAPRAQRDVLVVKLLRILVVHGEEAEEHVWGLLLALAPPSTEKSTLFLFRSSSSALTMALISSASLSDKQSSSLTSVARARSSSVYVSILAIVRAS